MNKKCYENISIGAKPLRIMFREADEFMWDYDQSKYFLLFGLEKYATYDRIRYLMGLKGGIACVFSHNYPKDESLGCWSW